MTTPLTAYTMVGQLIAPPYQSVYWLVYNTPDTAGTYSGYVGQLQNIAVSSQQTVSYPVNVPIVSANALQDIPISNTAPTTGQALVYNGTQWTPVAQGGFLTGLFSARPDPSAAPDSIYIPTDLPEFVYESDGTQWWQRAYGVRTNPGLVGDWIGGAPWGIIGGDNSGAEGDCLFITSTNADANLHGYTMGAFTSGGGGVWTLSTALKVISLAPTSGDALVGILITNSDASKFLFFGLGFSGGTVPFPVMVCFTGTTTASHTSSLANFVQSSEVQQIRIRFDGTNYHFEGSVTGSPNAALWVPIFPPASTIGNPAGGGAWLVPAFVGVGLIPNANNVFCGALFLSVLQTPTNG